MSAPPRGGGLRAFRLVDVPKAVREQAADLLLTTAGTKDGLVVSAVDPIERLRIALAADRPSEKVYWISMEAWAKAERRPTWRRADR